MPRYKKAVLAPKRRLATAGRFKAEDGGSQYFDPTPEIQGTIPEKMVINRLILLGIPFVSQGYINVSIPELEINKDYRPDIYIPDIKLIIQVQGAYFHSKPEKIEADAYVNALYETVGYRVIDWWDYEILTNLDELFAKEPTLANWTGRRGGRETAGLRQSNIDDTKGIATLNKKRAKGMTQARVGRRKLRKTTLKITGNRQKGVKRI